MSKVDIVFIFFCFLVIGCSNFQFVYKNYNDLDNIKNKTKVIVTGDDASEISSYLKSKINQPTDKTYYHLFLNANKSTIASIVEKDATASKFSVTYDIVYNLENIEKNCLILNKTISTKSSYDSKSAGYSFGTDISEKKVSIDNIKSNVDEFLNNIITSKTKLDCQNES